MVSMLKQYRSSACLSRVMVRRRAQLSRDTVVSAMQYFANRVSRALFRSITGNGSKMHVMSAIAQLIKSIDDAGLTYWVNSCDVEEYVLGHNGVSSTSTNVLNSSSTCMMIMPIDAATTKQLSLYEGSPSCSKGSLFSILNETSTRLGAKTLRRWLSAPSKDFDTIVFHQTAMKCLYKVPDLCDDIQGALKDSKMNVEVHLNRVCLQIQAWIDSGELDKDDGDVLTEPLNTKYSTTTNSNNNSACVGGLHNHINDANVFVSRKEEMLKGIISDLSELIDASSGLSTSLYRYTIEESVCLQEAVNAIAHAAETLQPLQIILEFWV